MQTFELRLLARPELLRVVRHVLGALHAVWAVEHEVLDDVAIAVTEACSNVVTHAYGEDIDGGLLEVRGELDGSVLRVRVRDHGRAVAPQESPDCQLSLGIIAALADDLELSRGPNGANDLSMTFSGDRDAGP